MHGPAGLLVRFRILQVDGSAAVRRWSWSATTAGITLRLGHTVEAVGTGTRTGLTVEGPSLVVAGYLPVARLALHRLVH